MFLAKLWQCRNHLQLIKQTRLGHRMVEFKREGLRGAWVRETVRRPILKTPAMRTDATGEVEVRVLTCRRDVVNLLWTLKSFYHFAGVTYPLYVHDGGLGGRECRLIKRHFPDATIVRSDAADARVAALFEARGLTRCLAYRRRNPATKKLFDFYLLSRATYVISIDSDVLFFSRPEELIVPAWGVAKNLYNKDGGYWYTMPLEKMERLFGLTVTPLINSGLSLVNRASIDFERINEWLANPELFGERWITEQTLHAMCGAIHGVALLPASYDVEYGTRLEPWMVSKHYAGYGRHLLYEEGMKRLTALGFINALRLGKTVTVKLSGAATKLTRG